MRVIVTGGRNYDDREKVHQALTVLLQNSVHAMVIIDGGAKGADKLAREFAKEYGVCSITYKALWRLGRAAGPERNKIMIRESRADLVLAFPGGNGTKDCVRRARAAGIPVFQVE